MFGVALVSQLGGYKAAGCEIVAENSCPTVWGFDGFHLAVDCRFQVSVAAPDTPSWLLFWWSADVTRHVWT